MSLLLGRLCEKDKGNFKSGAYSVVHSIDFHHGRKTGDSVLDSVNVMITR